MVKLQIMTEAQARESEFDSFDLTKVWRHADFLLIEVGRLTLDRNVDNYFAETEQSAFSPSNLVPGGPLARPQIWPRRISARLSV